LPLICHAPKTFASAGDPKTMTGVEHDTERHAMETSNHQRPDTMTPQARIAEVAAILAHGLQRLKGVSATSRRKVSQTSQQSLASKRKLKRS
jgi:hypothetical protein